MTIVVLVIVALVIVIGLGYLIVFRLMKGSQTVVPEVADERAAKADRVVAVDDQGRLVTESQDMPEGPRRDEAGFEKVLVESLDDLHPDSER
jgi:beta-lactam-binding protein with PASTA domain